MMVADNSMNSATDEDDISLTGTVRHPNQASLLKPSSTSMHPNWMFKKGGKQ